MSLCFFDWYSSYFCSNTPCNLLHTFSDGLWGKLHTNAKQQDYPLFRSCFSKTKCLKLCSKKGIPEELKLFPDCHRSSERISLKVHVQFPSLWEGEVPHTPLDGSIILTQQWSVVTAVVKCGAILLLIFLKASSIQSAYTIN